MLRKASLFLVLPFAFAVAVPLSASAVDCSSLPGTHPAIANEVPGVRAGTCTPDNKQQSGLNGGCDFNPYPVIESFKTGGNIHITPSSTGEGLAGGLNPALACRLAHFLQYAQAQGCGLRISSGYRSAQEQYNICGNGGHNCGEPGKSCHQYGLAADLTGPARCMAWAKQILGSKNPNSPGAQQFKLHWPIQSDDGHTQCIEDLAGLCSPSTQPCDGSVRINPDLSVIPGPGSNMPFDQQARRAFGVPPPPPPPMQQQQPMQPIQPITQPAPVPPTASSTPSIDTLNSTPYPPGTCNPQTYCSQSDGNIYYRATTCVDQVYKKCGSGCTGFICNATSTSDSNFGGLFSDGMNGNSNTNSNSNGSSTFDLIDFFANPPTAMNIGTATPIDITNAIENTGNAAVLQPSQTGPGVQTPRQASTTGYGLSPQQTFTSPDLANSPPAYGPQSSTFQAVLANIKAILIAILNHLQPFGGRIGGQQIYAE